MISGEKMKKPVISVFYSRALLIVPVFLLGILLLTGGCGGQPKKPNAKPLLPLTAGNIKAHKNLYNEGWKIIPSVKKTFEYAHQKSITSSGQALAEAWVEIGKDSKAFKKGWEKAFSAGGRRAGKVFGTGTKISKTILKGTDKLAQIQFDFGKQAFSRAGDFITGGIYYGKRTGEHWKNLKNTWPNYFGNLKKDFSNIWELNNKIVASLAPKIKADWDGAFTEAAQDFQKEYEESGTRGNTLEALGDILPGWLKMLYSGVAKPSARALVQGTMYTAQGVAYVFTPVASVTMLAGRTVQSTGLSFYHATRTGIEVVAPTVEAGFLTAIGAMSYVTGGLTVVGGSSLALVNQVAFTGAAGVASGGETIVRAGAATGKYAALMTYDVVKGGTKVVINQVKSGVALGYAALTQIPAHLLLLVPDTLILLVFDGPRLVIVSVQGALKGSDKKNAPVNINALPVGTVVDLEKLKKNKNLKVKVLTDDPAITKKVLLKASEDLGREATQ